MGTSLRRANGATRSATHQFAPRWRKRSRRRRKSSAATTRSEGTIPPDLGSSTPGCADCPRACLHSLCTQLAAHFLAMKRLVTIRMLALSLVYAVSVMAEAAEIADARLPTLWLIGDSTVQNGSGNGEGGLWGWGAPIAEMFDRAKIVVNNHARGGRSSRTFLTEGLWEKVLAEVEPGDFVMMQFGH